MARACLLVLLPIAIACGGETPSPKPPPVPVPDAGRAGSTPDAGAACATVVLLPGLPSTPPATRCASALEQPVVPPKEAIARELAELASAPADLFLARRTKLLARGAGALKRLRELGEKAPTPRERALAAALVTRIEKPSEAKRLDDWAAPASVMQLRNPFPAARKLLLSDYSPFPELAFEALARARDGQDASPPHGSVVPIAGSPLFDVVSEGPEAYARLAELAPRFPGAFALLVGLDAERGTCAALSWLDGKLPEASDEGGRSVLGTLASDDPLALHLLRQALRAGSPAQKAAAGAALARRKDLSAVPDLLASLADKSLASDARSHLVTLLGAAEAERKLAELAKECRVEHRLGAALALRWSPAESASELLAGLAGDADAKVRGEALDSLAWLSLTRRDSKLQFADSVELAVIAATRDTDPDVRRQALNALWRLVVEKRRSLDDAMRSAWGRALSDSDPRARSIALVELDAFFAGDSELILVLLGDLGRVPDQWPHKDALARARQNLGRPTRERVSVLARASVPEIRALAEAWLAK